MTTLAEFLKDEARKWGAKAAEREARRDEWIGSVERLLQQIQEWLKQADTEGVLAITTQPKTLREQSIGEYTAPSLTIGLGALQVQVVPIARNVVGTVGDPSHRAEGRVDMTGGGGRFKLYRKVDGDREYWLLVDDRDYSTKLLDREAFEAALLSLLA